MGRPTSSSMRSSARQCPTRGAALFPRHGNTADTLCRPLEQGIDMRLAGRSDDHHVVSPVPRGHPHAAHIIFEPAGCDFRRDHAVRLRIDKTETAAPRKRNGLLKRFRCLKIFKIAGFPWFSPPFTPMPRALRGMIIFETVENFPDINSLIHRKRNRYLPRRQLPLLICAGFRVNTGSFVHIFDVKTVFVGIAAHDTTSPNSPAATSQNLPSARASPASRTGIFSSSDTLHTTWPAPLPINP